MCFSMLCVYWFAILPIMVNKDEYNNSVKNGSLQVACWPTFRAKCVAIIHRANTTASSLATGLLSLCI